MKNLFFVVFAGLGVILAGCSMPSGGNSEPESEAETFSFSDANEIIYNPDMGFYRADKIKVTGSGITNLTTVKDNVGADPTKYNGTYCGWAFSNLVHLRFDISAFSSANTGGTDGELTETAISDICEVLDCVRQKEKTAIVRFAYDPDYSGATHQVDGDAVFNDIEPSDIDVILGHVDQICNILKNYEDILTAVECGMVGPWGEMHSTTMASNLDNITAIMGRFLTGLSNVKTPLLVRQPLFIYEYLNLSHSGSVPLYTVAKNSDAYRLGMYNDGYLGSSTDLDTYKINRSSEIEFMKQFTNHTPYGGEVCAYNATDSNLIGDKSRALWDDDSSIEEMYDVHLSYLNMAWNNNVLAEIQSKSEYNYHGENRFEYILKHMGYRFVLTKSKFTKSSDGKYLRTEFMIKNNGFANLPMNRSKKIKVILCKSGTNVPCATYTLSETFDSTDEKEITITVGKSEINIENLESAERYDVYLKLCDDEGKYAIRFANPSSNWNSELKANYAGTFIK